MKNFVTWILVLITSLGVSFAQNITEGSYAFIKKVSDTGNGLSMTVYGTPDVVTTVLEKSFKAAGAPKIKSVKAGIQGMEGARLANISSSTLDYYYKVEKAGKNEPEISKVTVFLSAGNYNFLNSNKNPEEIASAKAWMSGLQDEVHIYQKETEIQTQEKNLEKAQKEQQRLQTENAKLEKVKAETISSLEKNVLDQEAQVQKIKDEEKALEVLKDQFKTMRKQ